ncbi:MAG: Lrp/AsnC family transcriptional regulator [Chloroherpetonaceae bacterium]|nr:Lrp/AsnC family transcriptional regulator [Chloroherpetonaceae bacterium]MCS7212434.1 Lrp/AsnC family transcriptional regulator [Chloroherpetonaceae bacterium]MDW8019311.1 Lrp/AsnC family transcriptional regulator [Chloroherpetonaceae bacterium]
MSWHLDKIDLKLIEMLSEDGRARRSELAEAVGLSIPSVSERLEKLEARGVIKGFTAIVDVKKLGYDIIAFIRVTMDSSKHYPSLIQHVQKEDEITECYSITGEGSHLIKAIVSDTGALERLLARIQSWTGVTGTQTDIVLSEIKRSNRINAQKTLKCLEHTKGLNGS